MKTISIIVPAFNEEKTIGKILEKLLGENIPGYAKEIIVVNDGSSDKTGEESRMFSNKIIYLEHAKNQGKGMAVRTGIAKSSGELVLIQDADLEYHPADIPRMLEELESSRCDAVYGSRNMSLAGHGYHHYFWGGKLLTKTVNLLCKTNLSDSLTGYKLIKGSLLRSLLLKSTGFEIEVEITAELMKGRYVIREVPIAYSPRSFAAGKKIRMKDGIKILVLLLYIRFR